MRSLVKVLISGAVVFATHAAMAQEMPQVVQEQGRATLMVDGKPFWMLGAQVDNSSGWPERLQVVWPAAEKMRLNTLEVPVYWEQMEPERGRFDFTVVDAIVQQAREHKMRLVVWHVEEREDALCAGLGEVRYGGVSANDDTGWPGA